MENIFEVSFAAMGIIVGPVLSEVEVFIQL